MALFGDARDQTPEKQGGGVAAPNQINMVAEGTVFEGTLRSEGDVRVSGRIVGKVTAKGRVVVAAEGLIEGELIASNADVAGSVDGEVQVEERLILRSAARVEGTVRTGRLIVEEGAVFNGECQMGQGGQLRKQTDAAREVAVPKAKLPDVLPATPRLPDGGRKSDAPRTAEGSDPARARVL